MARYTFASRRRDKKSWKWTEFSLWFGIFVYFTFLYFTVFQNKDIFLLTRDHRFLAISLLLFLLLVYFPTKRSIRLQKQASTIMETDRKGLHYKDFQKEMRLAWRDMQGSTIVLDTHPVLGVYPREFRLRHSKGTISIQNDPFSDLLEGVLDFLVECSDKLPDAKQVFISFTNFCPYCGLEKTSSRCSCGKNITWVHKLKRPLTLIKDEVLMMIIATFFLGPLFFVVGFALIAVFLFLPYLLMRNKKLKTIDEHLAEKNRAAEETAGGDREEEYRESAPVKPQKSVESGEPGSG